MSHDVFQQNLSQEASRSGVYMIWLLFHDEVESPSTEQLHKALEHAFNRVDIVNGDGLRSFALLDHLVTYKNNEKMPSQVMLSECMPVNAPHGDALDRSQFWDVQDGAALLDACPWQVMVSDFVASGLPHVERAEILSTWLDICLALFPTCQGVYFEASRKLLTAEQIRSQTHTGISKLLYGMVNARFFNIQGTDDMLVDTLGLYAFGLPDVQYHFHGLDPNAVVNHAYNTAAYQFEHNAPIQSGHTIEGLQPGSKWTCRYEPALVQPARDVLDMEAGEFSSGNRT